MANEIISYIEMCRRELSSLQRGMNFDLGKGYSVILMSIRPNAPYRDLIEEDGTTLIYEGHDAPRTEMVPDPKAVDQPDVTPSGSPTQNGLFFKAAELFKRGEAPPTVVRVYEKIKQGIWSYNGLFDLVDAWRERDRTRTVFKFKLTAVEGDQQLLADREIGTRPRRIIPTSVKIDVWNRDKTLRDVRCHG